MRVGFSKISLLSSSSFTRVSMRPRVSSSTPHILPTPIASNRFSNIFSSCGGKTIGAGTGAATTLSAASLNSTSFFGADGGSTCSGAGASTVSTTGDFSSTAGVSSLELSTTGASTATTSSVTAFLGGSTATSALGVSSTTAATFSVTVSSGVFSTTGASTATTSFEDSANTIGTAFTSFATVCSAFSSLLENMARVFFTSANRAAAILASFAMRRASAARASASSILFWLNMCCLSWMSSNRAIDALSVSEAMMIED
mmetsp:Transcript_24264/g.51560  ORF Transcript_24264/g.51560 Transcript_24264/m.51560 type:complete len:258 (-) Transcript_24264:46-819(-)